MNQYTQEAMDAYHRWNGILASPSKESLAHPHGIAVMKNDFVEKYLARAHPIVPGLWVIPFTSFLFYYGLHYQTLSHALSIFFVGILAWTLLEYCIHLFLFHFKITPKTHPRVRFLIFMLHGYHHEFPNDPNRLVMPILLAWPLAAIVGLAIWLVLGTALFFHFFAGILVGYLAYDWVHYYTHHGKPLTRAGVFMRKFHAIHHYVDPNKNFGLSSPLWDWVLRTFKAPKV